MEIVKVLKEWDDGTRTVLLSDGSSAVEIPDAVKVSVYDYPRLNKNKAHEYVTGRLEPGKGYDSKVGILSYDQAGFKYDRTGTKIVGKGKVVKQKKGV